MLIKYNSNEYKIYFKHIRKTPFQKKMDRWDVREVVPNDVSLCFIENNFTKEIITQGLSKCSKKDRFIKEVGRQISLTRALRKYGDVELSYLIFEEYFKNKPLKSEITKIFTKDLSMNPNYFKEEF